MLNRLVKNQISIFIFLLLLLLLSLLAFCFQGSRGIWQPDEGYYTGTAVTMMARESVFIPYLGEHEIFLDKPPMIYWGIIAGIKLFGHSEFSARFFHSAGCLLAMKDDDISEAITVLKSSDIECRVVHLSKQIAMLFPYSASKAGLGN